MIINVALALTFVASAAFFWRRVSERLPELTALPDEAISKRLHHEAPRWYLTALRYRMLVERKALKDFGAKSAGKILQRFHIILMRLDNGVVGLTRRVRGASGTANGTAVEEKPAVKMSIEAAPAPERQAEPKLATPRRIRKRPVAADIAPRSRRTADARQDV